MDNQGDRAFQDLSPAERLTLEPAAKRALTDVEDRLKAIEDHIADRGRLEAGFQPAEYLALKQMRETIRPMVKELEELG